MRLFAALLASLALAVVACGGKSSTSPGGGDGGTTSAGSGGSAGAAGTSAGTGGSLSVACAVCANPWFTCASPGAESVNFQIETQSATGCAGHIVQFSGPTTAYTLSCDPAQVCGGAQCYPATLTATTFSWSSVTCFATSK